LVPESSATSRGADAYPRFTAQHMKGTLHIALEIGQKPEAGHRIHVLLVDKVMPSVSEYKGLFGPPC
jgi:hypothetical protein